MKKLKLITVIPSALMALALVVQAGVSEGSRELALNATLSNQSSDGGDTTSITAGGTLNQFIKDNVSVGGNAQITMSDSDNSESATMFFLGRADYYFSNSNPDLLPYAGVDLGLSLFDNGTDSESGLAYGVHGGMKQFLTENTSFNMELQFLRYSVGDFDFDTIQALFGFSYYLD